MCHTIASPLFKSRFFPPIDTECSKQNSPRLKKVGKKMLASFTVYFQHFGQSNQHNFNIFELSETHLTSKEEKYINKDLQNYNSF